MGRLISHRFFQPVQVLRCRRRSGVALAVTVTLIAACARSPESISARILIAEDTTILVLTPDAGSFRVNAAIINEGPRTLYLGGCGPEAQRMIGTEWQTVWTPICVGTPGMTSIPAGDSLRFPVVVFGFREPNHLPALDPRIQTGVYRLRFGLAKIAPDATGPVPLVRYPSTAFIVLDTTSAR